MCFLRVSGTVSMDCFPVSVYVPNFHVALHVINFVKNWIFLITQCGNSRNQIPFPKVYLYCYFLLLLLLLFICLMIFLN